jgi:LexA-binding, inner membrane-associated putative hydrolase
MRSIPHITIACGSIWAGSRLLGNHRNGPAPANDSRRADSVTDARSTALRQIDYRLVALGSLLPDLVDRAQRAGFRVRRSSPDQHFLGHTLLLNVPLLLAGICLLRRHGDGRLLSLSAAAMTHLLVDPVIRSPETLLWPLFGLEFPAARGLSPRLTALTQIGAASALVMAILSLQRRNRLGEFISSGRL